MRQAVKGVKEEEWRKLCQDAATEQDHDRLLEIIDQINRMLWDKEQRLKEQRTKHETLAS